MLRPIFWPRWYGRYTLVGWLDWFYYVAWEGDLLGLTRGKEMKRGLPWMAGSGLIWVWTLCHLPSIIFSCWRRSWARHLLWEISCPLHPFGSGNAKSSTGPYYGRTNIIYRGEMTMPQWCCSICKKDTSYKPLSSEDGTDLMYYVFIGTENNLSETE